MADAKKAIDFADIKKFFLIVDLHSNSKEYSKAAAESGADALILHLNESPTQGARFGGLEIEEDSIKECLDTTNIPIGLSIGDARALTVEDWERCVSLGFAFVNMYAHHMPTFVWKDERLAKVGSLGPGYILEQIKAISEFKEFDAFVASFTAVQGFGSNLNVLDITTLKLITSIVKKPVLLPTQRLIRKEDVSLIRSLSIRGLILTSIVYGSSVETLGETIQDFKTAISMSAAISKK
jgi:hypothetical protein